MHEHDQVRVRLHLGKSLSLALELLLAADILLTAVAPSGNAIGQLAAIVALRTVLNFFLHREIAHEQRELRKDDRGRIGAEGGAADLVSGGPSIPSSVSPPGSG